MTDNHNDLTSPPTSQKTNHAFYHPAPSLATSRYNRQLLVPQISLQGQQHIARSKVLIIGLGGLGSPASLYLAGAGIHTLGLLDHDSVETSNLHRQIVHTEASVSQGLSKVESALRGCRALNSSVSYLVYEERLTGRNALEIIDAYDIVLDCTDNPATRYLISDCCVVLGKTLVSGAAQRLDGQMMVLSYPIYGSDEGGGLKECDRGPCYRCVFPHPPSPEMVHSCAEIGILGPVVGLVGTLMASETLRLIVRGGGEERKPTMWTYSAWPGDRSSTFRTLGIRPRRKQCVVCGDEDVLKEKGLARITKESIMQGVMDYESWCGVVEDIRLLDEDQRVNAEEFLEKLNVSDPRNLVVVDVREDYEIELGPKIEGSINVSITRILRNNTSQVNGQVQADKWDSLLTSDEETDVYFVCQRGNDSQIAAKKLMDRTVDRKNGTSSTSSGRRRWIGDVKGGYIALDKMTNPG